VWWEARTSLQGHYDSGIVSGISGYANQQATICCHMAEQCVSYWIPHLKDKDIIPSWASYFSNLSLQRIQCHTVVSVGETENVVSEAEDVDEESCSDDEDYDLQGDNEDSLFDMDD